MSPGNNDRFISSFSIWITFIFSCLSLVAGTSSTMLNKIGESGHLSLVPDVKKNFFRFSSLSMRLPVGLSYKPLLHRGTLPLFSLRYGFLSQMSAGRC